MLRCTCIIIGLLLCSIVSSQMAVSKEIQNLNSAGVEFQKTELFNFHTNDLRSQDLNLEGLKKGTIVSLDLETIKILISEAEEFISIPIPLTERSEIILMLKRHEIFTPDFKVFTSSDPAYAIDYQPGLHYMGIVEGDPTSLVALSIFNDEVMAMIATDEGNMVIGPIKGDDENKHIIYNDRDLDKDFIFECGAQDNGLGYTEEQLSPLKGSRDINDCVRLYVEIDDNIVTGKGGAINAVNFVTAMFNQSFLIYANESINVVLSEILAWTTNSPYEGETQALMLASYKDNTELFNGDVSQLVTYSAVGGSAAGTNGLCNGNPDLSKCYSHIDSSFNNIPVYSWTVFVITHENGHLLGSKHTHVCVWNGNNTAIDGCYETYPCPRPPIPPNGGTIMSYCYLPSSGSFVDFNLGFGPQPGNVIRNSVNTAGNCLTECGTPTNYCTSNGTNSSTEFINKIILNSINNPSGNNGGYGNYTSLSTSLNAGNTYAIALTPMFTGGNKIKFWRVWIDYNHDFDWYDAGEMVAQGSGNNTLNINFTVPSNSISTTTRMRVTMGYGGYTVFCGTFPTGEVEDYTVVITGTTPTCSDGIQNQGESEIDCGGPCPACPPAPTCMDGIQNQSETGVDCGGPCPACPQGDSTVLLGSYFETGMDSWTDGGPDVARVSGANAWEGQYSIELADNSGAQSAMTSPVFNLSDAVGLQITFHFKAVSMETGEDFWVQYKNGSGNWTTIESLVAGTHFTNGNFYSATVTVPGFVPTSAGSLRIQSYASDNNDEIYIDAVTIVKLNGTELIESGTSIQQVQRTSEIQVQGMNASTKMICYPNPSNDVLNVKLSSQCIEGQSFQILSFTGQQIITRTAKPGVALQTLNVSDLPQGMYFVQMVFEARVITTNKFVKQ